MIINSFYWNGHNVSTAIFNLNVYCYARMNIRMCYGISRPVNLKPGHWAQLLGVSAVSDTSTYRTFAPLHQHNFVLSFFKNIYSRLASSPWLIEFMNINREINSCWSLLWRFLSSWEPEQETRSLGVSVLSDGSSYRTFSFHICIDSFFFSKLSCFHYPKNKLSFHS